MALLRRSGQRFTANIWPGFVDAMTALLLVLMFVLTIFMVMQFVLQETISGQDRQLQELGVEITSLAEALGLEQQLTDQLETEVGSLTGTLAESEDLSESRRLLIASLEADIRDADATIADFEAQVASLLAANTDLDSALTAARTAISERDDTLAARDATLAEQEAALAERDATLAERDEALTASAEEIARLRDANAQEISRAEALQLALANARSEIDQQTEQARLAAAQREALEALIADLETEATARETSLADLAAQLDRTAEQNAERAAQIATLESLSEEQRAELADLSTRLDATEGESAERAARIAALETDLDAAAEAVTEEERARLEEAAAAQALRERLADAEGALSEEEAARLAEAAAAEALRERLAGADAELTAMTLALEERRREAEETLTLLAAEEQARRLVDQARADDLSELERQRALLAQANELLSQQRGETSEARREIALLNQQSAALRQQLSSLQGLLDEAEARDEENEVRLEALGSQLNTALAQVAADQRRRAAALEDEAEQLRQYRSEFFGRMRELLGNQDGVRVVGDRFVFSSEVLFEPGSAQLGFDGRGQITEVARVIQSISDEIPEDIDWVLQVNGHTDRIPVGVTSEYADNWELSQARALSVVRYLAEVENIPPGRLAAAGYGQYQPIDEGDSFEALARNRRIELKFTER
ncbi:peptidoglycan -binding protein [Roseobacter sp. HKCCA0434]|uniref:peptidoglycan -binding protein n=1 Tax=Roseobacter sp. HKCCA0434 TaxID=3079297 RepID=UPI0029058610|nr:peptidoglycan -binding protein [Roseobacter sp. HKCCA0434]